MQPNPPFKPNIMDDIDVEWLKKTASLISEGTITLKQAAKKAIFLSNSILITEYPVSERTLVRLFNHYNIKYSVKRGAPKKAFFKEQKEIIKNYYETLRCGETLTFHSIKATHPNISQYQVQTVFRENGYYQYQKQKNETQIRCRYQAKYVNQIWHSDIHYLKDTDLYLYGIIDDRSRYIVGYKILAEKTAEECREVLKQAIMNYGKPAIIWSDNGGENRGDAMIKFIREQRIYPVFIKPRNPQQNGKIEAFWPKLDNFIKSFLDITNYIQLYNNLKAHTGLEKGPNGNFLRPCDVFFDESLRWQRDYPWTWYKDGKEEEFKVDINKKKEFYD